MGKSTYNLIRQAIIEKKQVFATYNGHQRELCPHVIGTKNGRQQALFYQFGGTSSSRPIAPEAGSEKNWRCIPIDGLRDVEIREGQWYTSSDHTRSQTCVDVVDVEVDL